MASSRDASSLQQWLEGSETWGMKLDLENIACLLNSLGNPHHGLKVIHVAGTNGKGSVSSLIDSVLREAGYHVGLYTSPHLISARERIRIYACEISMEDWLAEIEGIKKIVEKKENFYPTYFEITTAMAFHYFFKQSVDFVVLETGMGGRLDSTNVVHSWVQVITAIDLDHTQYLGETLEVIATEKAGIIKQNSNVITLNEEPAISIIIRKAEEMGCRLTQVGKDIFAERISQDSSGQIISIKTPRGLYQACIRLLGQHQLKNAALAVGALEALKAYGVDLTPENIERGLSHAVWPGRFEVIRSNPALVLDAAHNPSGIRALVRTWKEIYHHQRCVLIFGALKDKDVSSMIHEIAPIVKEVWLVEIYQKRAMDLDLLKQYWTREIPASCIKPVVWDEILPLLQCREFADMILVAGSIYLLGEFLRAWIRSPEGQAL